MGKMRKGRECALQILYQVELGGKLNLEATAEQTGGMETLAIRPIQGFSKEQLDELIALFFEHFTAAEDIHEKAKALVWGVYDNIQNIDETIAAHSPKWKLNRMPHVDRNLLRLGAFELLFAKTPHRVVIDEGIEIAKRFGSDTSANFINGVLDAIAKAR